MIRTDFLDRGVPWTRLLLERRGRSRGTLAADPLEAIRMLLIVLALTALLIRLLGGTHWAGLVAIATAGAHLAACLPLYAWFTRQAGLVLGLAAIPLLALFYLVGFASGVTGLFLFVAQRRSGTG